MNGHKLMKRRSAIKIILVAIGLMLIVIVGWYWYTSTHPLFNPTYGFQFYQPTKLPAGFRIMEKRIDLVRPPGGKLAGIAAEMNLRTVDWVYEIQESRVDATNSSMIATTLNNYDPHSVGFTCEQQRSPGGLSYRLCHSVDYGKISVFWVNFIKGRTYISTGFPTSTNTVIPISQINTYVDSFEKANATGFTLLDGGI